MRNETPHTVASLREYLATLPGDMLVLYHCHSDYAHVEVDAPRVVKAVPQDFYYMRSHPTMSEANVNKEQDYLLIC